MATSGKPPTTVLLAVLAVAVSLHGAHSALTGGITADVKLILEKLERTKKVVEIFNMVPDIFKLIQGDKEKKHSTPLINSNEFSSYAKVVSITGIKVGSVTIEVEPTDGVVLLTGTIMPLTFLNKKAYQQLKKEIGKGRTAAKSTIDTQFEHPCYAAGTRTHSMTLVFAGENAEKEVKADDIWYEQDDGLICLAILQSPWEETLMGSAMQNGMVVVGNKLMF